MKKLLLALLIGIAGLGLVACDITQETPKEDDDVVEVIPGEDDDKEETPGEEDDKEETPGEDTEPEIDEEDEDIVYEDNVIIDESNLVRGEFKTVTLDVKEYSKIKITIVGESIYDIPVNINNFVVDGEAVEYSGMSGTSYVVDFDFKIGDLDAVANLMNTHEGDIRLHTVHHTLTDPHSLIINVEGVSEISFDYRVTTGAYAYIDSLKIGMAAMEPEIIEEDKEPEIIEEDKEPEIIEEDKEPEVDKEDKEPEIVEEIEEPVIEEDKVNLELTLDFEINEFVVFEYYVKGGDSGHHYKDDYIILYNGTEEDINLEGMHLQYNSQGNFTLGGQNASLEGTVKSKEFFIILSKGGTSDTGSKVQFNYDYKINISLGGKTGAFIITDTLVEGVVNDNKDVIILDIAYDKTHKGHESFVLNENKEYILKSLI